MRLPLLEYSSKHTCPPHNTPAHLTTHLSTSQHTYPPHNTPAHLTTHLPTSQHTCPPHNTPVHLTTHLPTSQHTCPPHNTPVHLTTHLSTSQHTCLPHNTPAYLTTHLPTSQHTCLPHYIVLCQMQQEHCRLEHQPTGDDGDPPLLPVRTTPLHTYHVGNLAISGGIAFGVLTDALKEKGPMKP